MHANTIQVANLYYSHPILGVLADAFDVSYERVSVIPTVMQGGYAAGLVFLCPLGDLVKRRPFVLFLAWFTSTVWLGLCLTNSFGAFVALSFITSVTTVTPVCIENLQHSIRDSGEVAKMANERSKSCSL